VDPVDQAHRNLIAALERALVRASLPSYLKNAAKAWLALQK